MIKKTTAILFMALLGATGNAQEPCASGRYASDVFSNVTVTSDITYGFNYTFSNQPKTLKLDLYQPSADNETKRPLIFWVHGGSFLGGTKSDADMVTLATAFAKKGYVCASIDYRTGFFPIDSANSIKAVLRAVHDLRAAVRYFYKDAQEGDLYKIDTTNIFIGGYSAGAITALHYAYLDKTCEVSESGYINQATLDQVGGMEGLSGNPCYSDDIKGVINIAGALARYNWLETGDVPFVSVHGTADGTVGYNRQIVNPGVELMYLDGSRMLYEQAQAVGVDNSFYTFYGQGHGFYAGAGASALAHMDTTQRVIRDFLIDQLGCTNAPLQALNTPAETATLYAVQDCSAHIPFLDCTAAGLENNEQNSFSIVPNPASTNFIINTEADGFNWILSDMNGRIVISGEESSYETSVDVSGVSSGIYMITVERNGLSRTERVIVD
ncbi:MAG: T9SS type A sorting domain-containing protein [Bacteroidota bacterium]